MKPIVEKMLSSGLVDKTTTKLLEQWGYLPDGSADKVNEDRLKDATREELSKFAEDLATEIERDRAIRETSLDLDKIRWPAEVSIVNGVGTTLVRGLQCVVDRMGRYFFRLQDVDKEWLVPGFAMKRRVAGGVSDETIIESQVLYIGDTPVCFQVSTRLEGLQSSAKFEG